MNGADIREWRKSRGLTQAEAAPIFKLTERSFAVLEKNRLHTRPGIEDTLREFDVFLGVPPFRPMSAVMADAQAAYEAEMEPRRRALNEARAALTIAERDMRAAEARANGQRARTIQDARRNAMGARR